jgi:hypothetical protein
VRAVAGDVLDVIGEIVPVEDVLLEAGAAAYDRDP